MLRENGRLRGHLLHLREGGEIVCRLLGMRRSRKDGALVVLQHLEPVGDIGGVILAHLRRQAKIGAQERACQFGDSSAAYPSSPHRLRPSKRFRRFSWRVQCGSSCALVA
jgi:hypothetical protein